MKSTNFYINFFMHAPIFALPFKLNFLAVQTFYAKYFYRWKELTVSLNVINSILKKINIAELTEVQLTELQLF